MKKNMGRGVVAPLAPSNLRHWYASYIYIVWYLYYIFYTRRGMSIIYL